MRGSFRPPSAAAPEMRGSKSASEQVSRMLTKLLRHRVHENGLSDVLRADGYLPLDRVLSLSQFASRGVTADMVREIVRANDKQRMALLEEDGVLHIRANQGHTAAGIDADALLQPLDEAAAAALCGGRGLAVHGTYHSAWPQILESGGLKRMSRHHVHLAQGLSGDAGVISGVRSSSQILIWVDVRACVAAGIAFYTSQNGVVLSPGRAADELIPLEFFAQVVDVATGREWRDGHWSDVTASAPSSFQMAGRKRTAAEASEEAASLPEELALPGRLASHIGVSAVELLPRLAELQAASRLESHLREYAAATALAHQPLCSPKYKRRTVATALAHAAELHESEKRPHTVLLGDSILERMRTMYGGRFAEHLGASWGGRSFIHAVGGDGVEHLLLRLHMTHASLFASAQQFVLMIGINNILGSCGRTKHARGVESTSQSSSVAQIAAAVQRLVTGLRAASTATGEPESGSPIDVCVCHVLHVLGSEEIDPQEVNRRVDDLNGLLDALTECRVVTTSMPRLAANFETDGLHLSQTGYETLVEQLEQALSG